MRKVFSGPHADINQKNGAAATATPPSSVLRSGQISADPHRQSVPHRLYDSQYQILSNSPDVPLHSAWTAAVHHLPQIKMFLLGDCL